jgi:hypothetical protein
MFRQLPEQRLWLAKQRQGELIHEASQYRLARAHPDEPSDHLATRLFTSIRAGVERPFAAVRRALSVSEAPCDNLCLDCAPC